jgi:hypothetical protein
MRFLITSFVLVPLGGCTIATSDATADNPPPLATTCHADSLDQFTGQPASQELGERMLHASGARMLRWVPKGGAVTMDFRGDRLTIALDEGNKVERASCG